VTLSINSTQPPLADKRARQALHYALDIGSIIKNLYAGQGKPFSGGVADTDFGYNASLKPYPFDPAKAKKLLAEPGARTASRCRSTPGAARWSTTGSCPRRLRKCGR